MENLTEHLLTGILLYSQEKGFTYANPAAQNILNSNLVSLNQTRQAHLANFFKLINEIESSKRIECHISGQYYNVYASKLNKQQYLIELSCIIYQDIKQATHELKRPLQNIKTLTETLLLGAKDDREKCIEYLNKLNYETDRLGVLVQDMLSLSYIASGVVELKRSNINLKDSVDKLLSSLENKTKEKNLSIKKSISEKQIISADEKLFEHLISNLIDNAIKYNTHNGLVNIEFEKNHLIISDTGLGIETKDQERIFEQFFRAQNHSHISGSGLGLSIVKAICDLHGWTISLESQPGKGTKFIVIIDR